MHSLLNKHQPVSPKPPSTPYSRALKKRNTCSYIRQPSNLYFAFSNIHPWLILTSFCSVRPSSSSTVIGNKRIFLSFNFTFTLQLSYTCTNQHLVDLLTLLLAKLFSSYDRNTKEKIFLCIKYLSLRPTAFHPLLCFLFARGGQRYFLLGCAFARMLYFFLRPLALDRNDF